MSWSQGNCLADSVRIGASAKRCPGRIPRRRKSGNPASTNASMSISLPLERAGMKAIITRLRRLEERVANHQTGGPSRVDVLRERRRRRLEASGLPYVERPREPLVFEHGRCATCAEVLRAARARRHAESLRAERVEQML